MLSGLAAFVYVAALWFIAPVFLRAGACVADRLRMLVVLGVAVPGALGLLHLLYAPLLWIAVAALLAWRARTGAPELTSPETALLAAFAGVLFVAWPPLARPLLDGDTLLYHLPNAVAFAQSHSVWVTRAPYWIYPPASELFACGLFAASGRWGLPLAGILPSLLITARLYAAARARGASALASAGVALAFICTPVAAFQVGTLQNDLWLAAFFVEVLTADRSPLCLAVCALIKPYGWVEGLIAARAARIPWRTIAIASVPLAIWAVRDGVLLARGASLGFSPPAYFATTIAGNFGTALSLLAHGIASVTPQAFVWIAMLAVGAIVPGTRRYAGAGIVAMVLYAFLPVSYSDGASTNFAVDASSLRYALPALAAGAIAAAELLAVCGVVGAVVTYALAAWGAWYVLGVFWNDAYTHYVLLAAAVAAIAALVPRKIRAICIPAAALAVVLAASWFASSRVNGFYADWMRLPSGKSTGVFTWIAQRKPPRVIATNVRAGAVLMSSPRTWVWAARPPDMCERARRERAILLVGTNEDLRGEEVARAFSTARSCGTVLFEDGAAILVQAP